jgi:hypothetical protein
VAPRLKLSKLYALHQHIVKALKQLECPQCFIHGWSGLTMAPNVYALLKLVPFTVPIDPGPALVYTQFAPLASIKLIDAMFEHNRTTTYCSRTSIKHASACSMI